MLELVNEGGADGGSGWVDVPLTNTSPFDIDCQYRFRVSGLAGNSVIPGFSQTHWYDGTYKAADAIASAGWYYFRSNNKEVLYGINTSNNDVWNATQLLGAKVTKIEKRCGGGGFTTGAGWENVPLTDTADYDTSCLYEVQLKTTDATNNNLMNGDTSWRTVTIRGNKHL